MRFRTKALAKRRQAEELDRLPEVAKPRGWLAAIALTIVVGGLLVYMLVGEIPRRVEADGVLGSSGGVIEVQSPRSGEVTKVLVKTGEEVEPQTPVAEVSDAAGRKHLIRSDFGGTVLGVRTGLGRVLEPGSDIVVLAGGTDYRPTRAFLFLSQQDGGGVAPGMAVDVDVATAPSARFGTVDGRVETVSSAPVSPHELDVLLSNDALVDQFSGSGAPIVATVALERADTPTGLSWSSGDGPDYPLRPGSLVSADIEQGDEDVLDVVLGNR